MSAKCFFSYVWKKNGGHGYGFCVRSVDFAIADIDDLRLIADQIDPSFDEVSIVSWQRMEDDPDIATVPVEPPEALLHSMAVRSDHGLGVPGYYDQPPMNAHGISHEMRYNAKIVEMRQIYEEIVGRGFYRPGGAKT